MKFLMNLIFVYCSILEIEVKTQYLLEKCEENVIVALRDIT